MLKKLKPIKFGVIFIISVFLTFGLSISFQSLLAAWTGPTATPPINNIYDFTVSGITFAMGGLRASDPSFLLGNVGIGTTSDILPSHNAKLLIQATSTGEGLRIISSAGWSPLVVMNNTDTADLFRVKEDGNVCIGGVCKNAWPTGGGATYSAGTGLSLSAGNSFSVDSTVIQNRVSGACGSGNSIRVIKQDGTVICESAGTGGGVADGTGPWATSTGLIYYNSGNVGIGTNNPSKKLSIVDGVTNMTFGTTVANTVAMDGVSPVPIDGLFIKSTGGVAGINLQSTVPGGCSGYTMTGNSGASTGYLYSCGNASDIALGTPLGNTYLANTTGSINLWANKGVSIIAYGTDNSNNGTLTVQKGVTAQGFFYSSDKNLKNNIEPISGALDKIEKINGVNFKWKDGGKKDVGVIAQDVEKVFPELVQVNPNTGYKTVEYGNLVAPLIEAVKDQQKMIKDLQREVKELKQIR